MLSRRDRVGSERGDVPPARPPAPPLAVCLAPLALPPSLIHSHVPSLSVCPDRTGQGLTAGEFLTLLFAFPRFSGNSRNLRRGENEDNLLNLLIPLNLSTPPPLPLIPPLVSQRTHVHAHARTPQSVTPAWRSEKTTRHNYRGGPRRQSRTLMKVRFPPPACR